MISRMRQLASTRATVTGLALVAVLLVASYIVGKGGMQEESVTTTTSPAAATATTAVGATARGQDSLMPVAPKGTAGGFAQQSRSGQTATTAAAAEAGAPSTAGSTATGGGLDLALAGIDRKIVSSANLQIEVAKGKFQNAYDQALQIADRYDGYVVSSQSSAGDQAEAARTGTITVRVPVVSFSQAMRDAGALGNVKSRQVDSQDVTGQYVDLQARLKNAEAQEQALQDLLIRAKSVNEVLQVRQVLSSTQQEIEQLKGQLQYLKEHTSYATLSLSLFEAGAPAVVPATAGWGLLQALEDGLRGFVSTLNTMIVGLGSMLPVLIVLGAGAWIVYRLTRPRRPQPPAEEARSI